MPRRTDAVQSSIMKGLIDAAARARRAPVSLWSFGEVLPMFDNHVTLSPDKRDMWDSAALRIHCAYGSNEHAMADDQREALREIADAAGLDVWWRSDRLRPPGTSVHEMGTARMGKSPRTSVLDAHNRSWDVPNLYVTDGSCFVSSGCQNPTLTIMALSARAGVHLADRLRAGAL
jgi:choline dehydrogenase-like flavoprotein